MVGSSSTDEQRARAREYAESLERDAERYSEERGEILLEAAGQWGLAGDHERALRIYDDLMATAEPEDVQYAAVSRVETLARLGREEEAEAGIERLRDARVLPGPASIMAEYLESRGRLEEALDWFDTACRDLGGDLDLDPGELMGRPELQGRARVRKALGLAPDDLDRRTGTAHAELMELLSGRPRRRRRTVPADERPNVDSFFVRSDVRRAFAEGLVQADDLPSDDVDAYLRRVELGWRAAVEQTGIPTWRVLPVTVDDLLSYAREQGRDPGDQQVRADHLEARIAEGAATVSWPPGRNDPCWCGSGRKYKKCCGTPGTG
ncbi:SEC-C metal-binding domain-containing protein [Thermomonospora cellulosilytica]|uniref:Tetratricopeptide (TPR) repeat protein n=1 Tax=Thermomonospora cellulosilytica TaxID=1411118 RepID=A0A7W3R9Z8_9ACTN|nr:SEC-C metal-binding domain-containing protein [Thermomonospora cellulosilytica]MBA9004815.1 tetratricopeptide (TPR) repeat protein [Thermomonospora cellulosilytica]